MIIIGICTLLTVPNWYIDSFSESKIYKKQQIEEKIEAPVAIVFGAAAYASGPSPVFADRLTVAANLYKSGMVKKILVSGDNSTVHYNEPLSGKEFLLDTGIKESDILLDYAGFRSYDTCMRAKKVFGINRAILVTQEFHLPRVVFLCEFSGIKSVGVSADMREYASMTKNNIREYIAQQVAFYQVFLLDYSPKFLGEEERIFQE